MSLPAEVYSVESVRRIDHVAINEAGIAGYELMTRAAQSALDEALAAFPDARRWQIVCGGGNNGGDGYALARLAGERGIAVSVLALSAPDRLQGDAKTAYLDYEAAGGITTGWEGALDADAELLVDALLGSGLQRDVGGRYADAVDAMNGHGAPVLALDIPTGINGDSGAIMGKAVRAALTVTFVGLKRGLFLDRGPACVGRLRFAGLDIPAECRAAVPADMLRISDAALAGALPRRPRNAHKGDFGHLLVIGGGPGMPGAVRLAGEAALRSGAGLVSIATFPGHEAAIVAGRPELMCHAIERPDDLGPLLERATTIALGPGLGTGDWSAKMFEVAVGSALPMVIDADGLNLLAGSGYRNDNRVLTPHPGEAARLLGTSTGEIQADRRDSVSALQQKYGGTIVLKGAGSLVSSQTGPVWLCTAGNPGMSAPGMGDVLTGIVGALLAQGLDTETAAVVGTEVHARAGDAAAATGERGLLASDLMRELKAQVNP